MMAIPVKPLNWRLIVGGFVGAAVLSGLAMAFLDLPAARFLRDNLDAGQRHFFGHWMGALGKPEVYFAAAAVAALACWGLRRRLTTGGERLGRAMHGALFVIFSVASAGILVNLLKFMIGRIRPREFLDHGVTGFIPFNTDFGMNSFPSGHSQMVWSLAVALFLIFPRLWPLLFTFAAAVAASRFLASVHFVSDVVMGSYIGAVVPLLLKHYLYDRRGIGIRP
ncbi:MAG: phosphatase PAP2 family protein [Elusimicrobiales bacterium]|nr:phosphatase PAP2 family protein [Elusimicrobiales bacterium]